VEKAITKMSKVTVNTVSFSGTSTPVIGGIEQLASFHKNHTPYYQVI
jgi:hypothetical protein